MDFGEIKRRVSIVSVLKDRGLLSSLKERGDDLVGPCPVHNGDNPNAFVVSTRKNLWNCFTRCNGGGDAIELVHKLDGICRYQAARYLDGLIKTDAAGEIKNENRLAYTRFRKQVDPRRFRPFAASLSLQHNTSFLKNKGIEPATAAFFETGAYLLPGLLSDCVAVRLHDLKGKPIGYAGRRLNPDPANRLGKWVFPKGLPKSEILYNFHRIERRSSDPVVVVESPWSVMRLAQLKIPAVALLGVNLFSLQLQLLKKRPKIVLMLDGDLAAYTGHIDHLNRWFTYHSYRNRLPVKPNLSYQIFPFSS